MLTNRFDYQEVFRQNSATPGFHQTLLGEPVARVTSILEATKSPESRAALAAWRRSIGEERARQITTEAASRGTRMHRWLEKYIRDDDRSQPGSNPYSQQSYQMAQAIISNYLEPNVTAYYGTEVKLCYPGLYAGTTDCVADWNQELSIIDFKQTNKPKTDERVTDYKTQLAAYALAHNHMFGTQINQGVILMCSGNIQPQIWVITGDEFQYWCNEWTRRVAQFYLGETPV